MFLVVCPYWSTAWQASVTHHPLPIAEAILHSCYVTHITKLTYLSKLYGATIKHFTPVIAIEKSKKMYAGIKECRSMNSTFTNLLIDCFEAHACIAIVTWSK